MENKQFIESLKDSEASFKAAIIQEWRTDFEFEYTLERKYEEGFIDGMRHAYTLLTGNTIDTASADEIERETREYLDRGFLIQICPHDKFSETVCACSQHGDDAPCHELCCDNCNEVILHENSLDGKSIDIEEHREKWATVAKEHGWYSEPFYIQVWVDPDTLEITDSVATRQLDSDIIVWDLEEEED